MELRDEAVVDAVAVGVVAGNKAGIIDPVQRSGGGSGIVVGDEFVGQL